MKMKKRKKMKDKIDLLKEESKKKISEAINMFTPVQD